MISWENEPLNNRVGGLEISKHIHWMENWISVTKGVLEQKHWLHDSASYVLGILYWENGLT